MAVTAAAARLDVAAAEASRAIARAAVTVSVSPARAARCGSPGAAGCCSPRLIPAGAGRGRRAPVGWGAGPGRHRPRAPAAVGEPVTVRPGETLWQIAERVAPGSDPRETVRRILDLNGLQTAEVQAGTALRLP